MNRAAYRPTRISGLATYVPPRLLTNKDLEKLVDTSDEWILQRTGIRERHVVDPGVATSDLAKEASLASVLREHQKTLAVAGGEKDEDETVEAASTAAPQVTAH